MLDALVLPRFHYLTSSTGSRVPRCIRTTSYHARRYTSKLHPRLSDPGHNRGTTQVHHITGSNPCTSSSWRLRNPPIGAGWIVTFVDLRPKTRRLVGEWEGGSGRSRTRRADATVGFGREGRDDRCRHPCAVDSGEELGEEKERDAVRVRTMAWHRMLHDWFFEAGRGFDMEGRGATLVRREMCGRGGEKAGVQYVPAKKAVPPENPKPYRVYKASVPCPRDRCVLVTRVSSPHWTRRPPCGALPSWPRLGALQRQLPIR